MYRTEERERIMYKREERERMKEARKARNRMYIHITESQRETEIKDGDEDFSPRGSIFWHL